MYIYIYIYIHTYIHTYIYIIHIYIYIYQNSCYRSSKVPLQIKCKFEMHILKGMIQENVRYQIKSPVANSSKRQQKKQSTNCYTSKLETYFTS